MKFFMIDESVKYHSANELEQLPGFQKTLNFTEKMVVLEEQLRSSGLQPYFIIDYRGSAFEIQPATKKFMDRKGQHARSISKRAQEYMQFCIDAQNREG